MKKYSLLILFLLCKIAALVSQPSLSLLKDEAIQFIDNHKNQFTTLSDRIWQYAEPSFEEYQSSRLIIEALKKEGFQITEKIGNFPTVFMAEYGTDKPIIGLFGEYDADLNASNKAVPYRDELVKGGRGHGGAHNLLGVGSLATALVIKELIKDKKLRCTIRYYGSTAEGALGTRAWLARDGFFKDLDLSLYWHPAPVTAASTHTWDALIDFNISITSEKVTIFQKNAALNNCQSAAEKILSLLFQLKQGEDESKKLNYSILSWKNELGSTPDTILLDIRIQCARQSNAMELFTTIKNEVNNVNDSNVIAKHTVKRGHHQFLPNITAMQQVFKNMQLLGPIIYAEDEIAFTHQMQHYLNIKQDTLVDNLIPFHDASNNKSLYGHSSDIGEASWFAPEIYFVVKCMPLGMKMHHWQGTAFTGHSIGHKGMLQAAKIMAMTIIDYVQSPSLQANIRKEFEINTQSYQYQSLISSQ